MRLVLLVGYGTVWSTTSFIPFPCAIVDSHFNLSLTQKNEEMGVSGRLTKTFFFPYKRFTFMVSLFNTLRNQ